MTRCSRVCAGATRPQPGRRPSARRGGGGGARPHRARPADRVRAPSLRFRGVLVGATRPPPGDPPALAEVVRDPEEIARHLALACEDRDAEVADIVEDAARRASSRGAPDTAAELTELALGLVPEGSPAVNELRLELAQQLYHAGDFQRASAVLGELRQDLPPGDLRAHALLALAEIDYWRKGESAAVLLAEEALGRRTGRSARPLPGSDRDVRRHRRPARKRQRRPVQRSSSSRRPRRRAGTRRPGARRKDAGRPLPR